MRYTPAHHARLAGPKRPARPRAASLTLLISSQNAVFKLRFSSQLAILAALVRGGAAVGAASPPTRLHRQQLSFAARAGVVAPWYHGAMCRRFTILTLDETLGVIQKIEMASPAIMQPDWPAQRPSAYPQSKVPVVVPLFDPAFGAPLAPGSLGACELIWGFEEPWHNGVIFNSRIESAAKPTWREAMAHRRCFAVAPSFFESHQSETVPSPKTGKPIKRPCEFRAPDGGPLFLGCIWQGDRFSVVTTEANRCVAPVHPRMPMVLRQDELPLWLGPNYQALADRSNIQLETQ